MSLPLLWYNVMMSKVSDKSVLRERALSLLKTNPLVSLKYKKKWEVLIEHMEEIQLQALVDVLENSMSGFKEVVSENFENDGDGELFEKFGEFEKKSMKKVKEGVRNRDEEAAEAVLDENLKKI